jgi:hypothetical protein
MNSTRARPEFPAASRIGPKAEARHSKLTALGLDPVRLMVRHLRERFSGIPTGFPT